VNRAIAWFVENPVAANLLMGLILVGGLVALPAIQQKTMPDMDIDIVQVSVEYLGAAPEEVESGVCIRIEEAVAGIEGIDRISSVATEGACHVNVELLTGYPRDRALSDIKNKVDGIDTFPEEAEKPLVNHYQIRHNELQIALSGRATERALKIHGERLRDGITANTAATQVELLNARADEISIEVSEESLQRHGLTFAEVVRAVRDSSIDLPGGSLKTPSGEILLRSAGQAYTGAEFEGIVVLTRPDGTRVLLKDIANVVDGFEEDPRYASFDGANAVMIYVYRVGEQKVLDLVTEVKSYVAEFARTLPEGLSVTIWRDGSGYLRDRLDVLIQNGVGGFFLVFVVLALFLRLRLAFWVAIGVPISILGALAVFPVFSVSIDVLTLFAFILVLGVLVDDAIVVGENIYTHQSEGLEPVRAAIRGAQEVSKPVVFGVLTTVTAFAPMILSPGQTGQMFGMIGVVVVICLSVSLIESQFVLPAHLGHHFTPDRPIEEGDGRDVSRIRRLNASWKRLQATTSEALGHLADRRYGPVLAHVLHWRYAAIATAITLLLLTGGVLVSGRMAFSFFPKIEADYVTAALSLPQGTPVETTAAVIGELERAALRLKQDLDREFPMEGGSIVKHLLVSVGEQPPLQNGPTAPSAGKGSHLGQVALELQSHRPITAPEVVRRWRQAAPPIPEAEDLVFSSDYVSMGDPIHFELRSDHVDQLIAAADQLKTELASYPGVFDVSDTFHAGKQEIKLAVLPEAEALGISLEDVARQVRRAFYGEEAQRIQRGRDDVKVMVRYPEAQRRSLADLENLRIRTPDGGEVPFYTVARAERGYGFASIQRTDRRRVIGVTADVDQHFANANQVIADVERNVLPQILADHPGLSYGLEGEQREQEEGLASLGRSYAFALFLIYALLAIPLRSYAQPLIIMAVIPFGLVGAIVGHVIMGLEFSMMSLFGVVALSGVVVNSSLVLVDGVNRRRAEGSALLEAVGAASVSRFRPIVLTSLTTFAGLTPLLLEDRLGARFLIPMATSLAFGVIFATAISLFLLPSAYLVLEDLHAWKQRRRGAASSAKTFVPKGSGDPDPVRGKMTSDVQALGSTDLG
jgi:multidrug efflux pump subunit AcrB